MVSPPTNGGRAGDELVKDGPQRINVGRRANLLNRAARLLGSHVAGRAHDVSGHGLAPWAVVSLAKPKSAILGVPSPANRTLAGFKSRWTIPCWCA